MSKLFIKNAQSISASRYSKVYLDGKKIGKVYSGESAVFEIEKGSHTLYVMSFLMRSPKIKVDLSEDKVIHIKESAFHFLIVPITILLMIIEKLIIRPLGFEYMIYGLMVFGLVSLYVIIFERSKFFIIEEVKSGEL